MYYVYLIECKDGTLYTGITTDVERRFKEHSLGRGGAYTQAKKVKKLLYTEKCKNRSAALKRESEIKSWRRKKKLKLISIIKTQPINRKLKKKKPRPKKGSGF